MKFHKYLKESIQADIRQLCQDALQKQSSDKESFNLSCNILADFIEQQCDNIRKADWIRSLITNSSELYDHQLIEGLEKGSTSGFFSLGYSAWNPKLNTAIKLFAKMNPKDVLKPEFLEKNSMDGSHFSVGAFAIIKPETMQQCIAKQESYLESTFGDDLVAHANMNKDNIIVSLTNVAGPVNTSYVPNRQQAQYWPKGITELNKALSPSAKQSYTLHENYPYHGLTDMFWDFIINNFTTKNDSLDVINDLEEYFE